MPLAILGLLPVPSWYPAARLVEQLHESEAVYSERHLDKLRTANDLSKR